MTTVWRESLRKHALPLLCLTLAPILIAVLHDDWLFTPVAYLDPWYNVGYFLNYFDPHFMPGWYKESRLSWLAPGALLYQMAGPLAASYVLHLGCLITAAILVYLTLERLVSRNAAFITAALLCAYYPFHNSGGWDYQTTPSGLFYALTLYLLTRGAQSPRSGAWLTGAGAAYAATFHADILFVNMAPVLAAHYLVAAGRRPTVKETATVAGWCLLGFVILTQVLSAVALSAGRDAMFYKPIVDIVFNYTIDPHGRMGAWWLPTSSGWFLSTARAAYLAPLAGIALAGIVALAGYALKARRGGGLQTVPIMLTGQFVFLFLLWGLWQAMGHVALQPDYFAYPLIVPAFIALGALIGPAGRRELILLGAALLAVMGLSLIGPARVPLLSAGLAAAALLAAMAAATAAGALLPRAKAIAVIAAAAVFLAVYPAMWPTNLWSQVRAAPGDCASPRKLFTELTRINALLLRGRPAGEKTWLWTGPLNAPDSMCDVPLDYFRLALVSSGVTPLTPEAQQNAADLPDEALRRPAAGDRVVAIVKDLSELPPLVARFGLASETLTVEHAEPVKFERRWAYLVIYDVKF